MSAEQTAQIKPMACVYDLKWLKMTRSFGCSKEK